MRAQIKHFREGIRKPSGVISIVANATPVNVYLLTAGRTAVIRKIHIFNANGATTIVSIGTGTAPLVKSIPDIFCVNGQDLEVPEEQIVAAEHVATITAQASVAAAAPNDVRIQLEVEEFMGPLG